MGRISVLDEGAISVRIYRSRDELDGIIELAVHTNIASNRANVEAEYFPAERGGYHEFIGIQTEIRGDVYNRTDCIVAELTEYLSIKQAEEKVSQLRAAIVQARIHAICAQGAA